MSDIFLSYSSKDKAKAQIIAKALEAQGCSVWWDRVIPPGKTFDEVIEQELDASKCVVVLWSKESVKSQWVRTEASEGNRRRILIPILIEDVQPPLAFRLIEAANLIDWKGTLPHPEFDLLLDSISKILGRPLYGDTETGKKKLKGKKELAVKPLAHEAPKKEEEIPNTFTNTIGMKFALIPAGEFMMGSEEDDSEKPVHKVRISKLFYLGIYPVTQREWKEVMGKNPSYFKGDNLPVESVTWNDVQEFIKKLNEKESTNKYSLPSEAEWEYAARANTTTSYYFGDDESELGDYAWYAANSEDKTHEVGQKKPNAWGLYDIYGGVWEWVQDVYNESYNGAPTDGSAWESGPWETGSVSFRVARGGSWIYDARDCRSTSRRYDSTLIRGYYLGFRLLREI